MQNKLQVDKAVRTVLLISASLSIVIVISIFIFIFRSSLPAFKEFGVQGLLGELTWRPANGSFGILAMIVGSVMVTLMALVIGVPLAIATAIFLAEIAPRGVQAVVRPAVQLLAGIPSVVYGLFGRSEGKRCSRRAELADCSQGNSKRVSVTWSVCPWTV